jgi:GTP cyclohydrolase I
MNLHQPDLDRELSRTRPPMRWPPCADGATRATPEEVADLDPVLGRLLPGREVSNYPTSPAPIPTAFAPDALYRATMPTCRTGRSR